jgi:hypothetical protein
MAVIVTNQSGNRVTIRGSANATYSMSDLAVAGESVTSATLAQIWCSSEGGGNVVVWRANTTDANNAIVRIASQDNAYFDFAGNGVVPDADKKTANVIIQVTGANTNYIVTLHKQSNTSVY